MQEMDADKLTGHATRVLTKLLYTAYVAVATIVLIAAGGAAWVTRTDMTLQVVKDDVGELRQLFASDFAVRIRKLETEVARGVLPDAQTQLRRHEERIDEIQRTIDRSITEGE